LAWSVGAVLPLGVYTSDEVIMEFPTVPQPVSYSAFLKRGPVGELDHQAHT